MKMKTLVSIIAVFATLMLLAPMQAPAFAELAPSSPVNSGPRAPGLIMKFYNGLTATYLALKAGQIDIAGCMLGKAEYDDAITDPNILLCPVVDLSIYQFDLNNNYTVSSLAASDPAYSMIRNPLNLKGFRQAVAHLVDKDYIVSVILAGFGVRNDVQIPAPSAAWINTSVTGVNYPYPYNLAQANIEFNNLGFMDWDGDGKRNYPLDWDMGASGQNPAATNVHTFVFYERSDDPPRLFAAAHLSSGLTFSGFTVVMKTGADGYCFNPVMGGRGYHIYTGAWRVNRYPTHLYTLYHDTHWYPYGPNYVTGEDKFNNPNYPYLNYLLEQLWYSPNIMSAMPWAMKAQGYIVDNCIVISLYTPKSFYAYRDLLGVVNMDAYGPLNIYTYMNAYVSSNPSAFIRIGLPDAPKRVNQIYSSYISDMNVLGGFSDDVIEPNPYDILTDQPWRATDWLYETWLDGITEKTQVTWWYWPNMYWIEPQTGNVVKDFNTEDVEFSIWYYYQTVNSWQNHPGDVVIQRTSDLGSYGAYAYVHSVERLCPFKVTIKFNTKSIWYAWSALAKQIPKAAGWLNAPLTTVEVRTGITADSITGYLPLPRQVEGAPVEIISCTNPTAKIELGYIKVTPGATVDVTYRARGDASGYYPGGMPWQTTLIGTGPFYMTDYVAGVGGYAIFNANRKYFLSTPKMGEVDWAYEWVGTPPTTPGDPSRTGYWKIRIFDVVGVASAYGSQSLYVPDVHWKPGADLARTSGAGAFKIRPNNPGTFTQWAPHPLIVFNYECVDDVIANDMTDYVSTSEDAMQDSYNLQDCPKLRPFAYATNLTVVVNATLVVPDGASRDDNLTIKLVIDGLSYYGQTHTLNKPNSNAYGYTEYSSSWATNPKTGGGWTWAQINALQAGFKTVQVGELPTSWDVTQLYVEVSWAIPPYPGEIDLFDIVTATGKYNEISMEHIFVSTEYFADYLVGLGAILPPGPGETLYAIRVWHATINILTQYQYCVTIVSRVIVAVIIHGILVYFIVWRVTVIHVTWFVWIRFQWCTWSIERWGGQNHPY